MKFKIEIKLPEELQKQFDELSQDNMTHKSEDVAQMIRLINSLISGIDVNFLKYIALQWESKSIRYDSSAALNPNYSTSKAELIMTEAKCIALLASFFEHQNQVTEMRKKEEEIKQNRENLSKLFE